MIDPMIQQKENDLEDKKMKHSCPYCHCDFTDESLRVVYKRETEVSYYYSEEEDRWIGETEEVISDKVWDIICDNCEESIYSFFENSFAI